MRNRRTSQQPQLPTPAFRQERGVYLVEMLVALVIGTMLMLASYGTQMATYRSGTTAQNQVLATNMAQQLIDNARNCTYSRLLTILNGSIQVEQTVPLYEAPTGAALYPRPLLRSPDLTYSSQADNQKFGGTVTQTLLNLTPGAPDDGMIRLDIMVRWDDTTGNHVYTTSTTISQTGIHN